MASVAELVENYVAGPRTLRQAVTGLTREQLTDRPVPGKWSILELVCHIADFEPVYAERMKRVIALEKPTFLGADENLFAAKLAYHDRDLEEELKIIETTRSQMGRILRTLPQSALERVGNHDERGPRTLENLITTITNHIPHHLKFVAEKRKALGLPA
jgi:uncharacterized damage-inducible protein DinB